MSEKTFDRKPQGERMGEVVCNVCHSRKSLKYWQCDGYQFKRCLECSLVYQNPQPIFDDLQHRYDDQYFNYEIKNEEIFFNLMQLGLNDIHFDKIEQGFSLKPKMMDIGCATGCLIEHFKKRGYEEQGVEICTQSAEYGQKRRGVKIFNGTLEESQFNVASFDFIHSSHVIEHVPNPRAMVKNIVKYLKPGGVVIIVTPNASGFQAKWRKQKWRSAIADHLWIFNKRNLRNLLEDEGLIVKKIKTWGGVAIGIPVPKGFKRFMDFIVKKMGWGDVMLFYAQKRGGNE